MYLYLIPMLCVCYLYLGICTFFYFVFCCMCLEPNQVLVWVQVLGLVYGVDTSESSKVKFTTTIHYGVCLYETERERWA